MWDFYKSILAHIFAKIKRLYAQNTLYVVRASKDIIIIWPKKCSEETVETTPTSGKPEKIVRATQEWVSGRIETDICPSLALR